MPKASENEIVHHKITQLVGWTLGVFVFALLFAASVARAEGDWPYTFESNQEFDNNYAKYKRDNGYSTNLLSQFGSFDDDGGLKFQGRRTARPGKGANEFEDARTGLQLDFNF